MSAPLASTDSGYIKLNILAHGIEVDDSVSGFAPPSAIALRKNVYNSPVWWRGSAPLPQELRVLDLVVGLNSYGSSPWRLVWDHVGASPLLEHSLAGSRYTPELIPDITIFHSNRELARVANLYGGAALAFFSPRSCYFFTDGSECLFCSLAGTASETGEFKAILSDHDVRTTVAAALQRDKDQIEQIMIVGGNMRDLDRGFCHHVSLALAAAKEIDAAGLAGAISIHIATMPPQNLALLTQLQNLPNVHVMFNLEVWEPKTFARICPGKSADYGLSKMLRALEKLRDTIGPFRAHSLLVTGLEQADSTCAGASALAAMGISPIINIYHSDRHSRLGLGDRPQFGELVQIAQHLQGLYLAYPIQPYWKSCGRNSIDAEAQHGLFHHRPPAYLT